MACPRTHRPAPARTRGTGAGAAHRPARTDPRDRGCPPLRRRPPGRRAHHPLHPPLRPAGLSGYRGLTRQNF
ncbi:hypothetical protein E3O68_12230 [Cryobacterium sp. TMB3-1-2]|nr:hypothetical protein E3O68_12230 [Cryobacterium sp. TMB3-1-2]TFC59200.1 hypothetical protein E3O60_09355 [Cryobacterium sp. TMB1-7]TFC69168.1 hypothetical protein E3T21_13215 [Cryobacterium sp. TMB3-15]TFD39895.1 hypothetical protein E3T58_14500 [Cryobacterium sp. TMB3-12]